MIFERTSDLDRSFEFIRELADLLVGEWVVYSPQYMGFESETLVEERELELDSGHKGYWLTAPELSELIAKDAIGFDWTDLRFPRASNDDNRSIYLQRIDSGNWYAETPNAEVIGILVRAGFFATALSKLPFQMQKEKPG